VAKIGWLSLMMEKIKQELENGGAVVLPTETVYGLFAKALQASECSVIPFPNPPSSVGTINLKYPAFPYLNP